MAYNASNSLSPMIFKKALKKDKEGTRNERLRSKSMEHIFDAGNPPPSCNNSKGRARSITPSPAAMRKANSGLVWKEVDKVKTLAPVVACILPAQATDFVASSLLAAGASPLITEG